MSWHYIPTPDDINEVSEYAMRIPENKRFGMRRDGTRGSEKNDQLAAMAEITVARWLDIDYTPCENRKNEVDIVIAGMGIEVRSSEWNLLCHKCTGECQCGNGNPSRLKVLLGDRSKFGGLEPLYAYVTGTEEGLDLHGFWIPNWATLKIQPSDFPERKGWWIERDELYLPE